MTAAYLPRVGLALAAAVAVGLATVALGLPAAAAALGVLVAVAGGVAIVTRPFVGVALIALISQIDGLVGLLASGLPGIKLLTAATLAGALAHLGLRGARQRLEIDPAAVFAAAFALMVLLSALFATDTGLAATGVRRFLSMIALFALVLVLVDSERKVAIVMVCIFASTAISAAIVVADAQLGLNLIALEVQQATTGGELRSQGASSADATTAASVLLAGAGAAMVVALRASGWLRAVALIALAVAAGGIVMSYTRSATLGLGLAIGWQMWQRRDNPAVVIAALVAVVAAIPLIPDELVERLRSIFGAGSYDFTLSRRIGYHVIALDLFARHPLFGIGPDNFALHYLGFDYRFAPGRTFAPRVMHNMYLAVAVEIGLFGLMAFLGILASALGGCIRALRTTASPALSVFGEAAAFGFALLLVVSATLPNETNKYVWIYAGLCAAIARIEIRRRRAKSTDGRP